MKTYDMSLLTKKIYDSSVQMYTLKSLREILAIEKESSLYKVLNRLVGNGVLKNIERDKYVLNKYSGSDFSLANFIYEPSYISFESALSHYGILSQFPYEVTSATLKQTKSKEFNGRPYNFYRLKKELFWGYQKEDNYLIAEKEKALLDQIYLASKGIKLVHFDEYDLSHLDKKKIKLYLARYQLTKKFKSLISALDL